MTHDWPTLVRVWVMVLLSAQVALAPWRHGGAAVRLEAQAWRPATGLGSSGAEVRATGTGRPRVADRRLGVRRPARPDDRIDVLVVLALLRAALVSGASVTRALVGVGEALGTEDGRALRTVGAALGFGSEWELAWIGLPADLAPVRDCLHGSWVTGSAAGPVIDAAAAQIRRRRRWAAREASARLAVRLVLPLGLCFLPACLLLGLVPIVLSLVGDLWR